MGSSSKSESLNDASVNSVAAQDYGQSVGREGLLSQGEGKNLKATKKGKVKNTDNRGAIEVAKNSSLTTTSNNNFSEGVERTIGRLISFVSSNAKQTTEVVSSLADSTQKAITEASKSNQSTVNSLADSYTGSPQTNSKNIYFLAGIFAFTLTLISVFGGKK